MNPTHRKILRGVIEERGWQSGSDLEDRAALCLSRMGVKPQEVRQQHREGPYRLDFAWPERRCVIEVDGFRHLHDPQTARKDAERDAYLHERGWLVFRVHDVPDEGLLAAMLCRAVVVIRRIQPLREREWDPAFDRSADLAQPPGVPGDLGTASA